MNQITEKLRLVEQEIAAEKGPLNLFAFLEREDLFERWDVVVSAPWAKFDIPTLRYLDEAIKRHLKSSEMIYLARIVILEPGENPVLALNETYDVEHGRVELTHPSRFGLPVKYGYIITSRRAA